MYLPDAHNEHLSCTLRAKHTTCSFELSEQGDICVMPFFHMQNLPGTHCPCRAASYHQEHDGAGPHHAGASKDTSDCVELQAVMYSARKSSPSEVQLMVEDISTVMPCKVEVGMLCQIDWRCLVCCGFNEHLQDALLGHDVCNRRLYSSRVPLKDTSNHCHR